MNPKNITNKNVWFVYDGECPLCTNAALALKIKKKLGSLNLLNARQQINHPLVQEINKQGYDLDEGMIIFDGIHFYHGKDALLFMARYGQFMGLFNLSNKALFWLPGIASVIYPWLRGMRNFLLSKRNVSQIDNLNLKSEPIFKNIFGDAWDNLPPIMQKHYANRPYSLDINTVDGQLDVMSAGPIKLFAPLFWLMGGIPPMNATHVPVTVHFESDYDTKALTFNRVFYFAQKPYRFRSHMIQTHDHEVIEVMRFGFGWKMTYHWENNTTKLEHKGYVFKLLGHFIPIPLSLILGKGSAIETPIDDDTFDMQVEITHPWWGKVYEYKGRFHIRDKT